MPLRIVLSLLMLKVLATGCGAVVINEMMPAPDSTGEWIELYNEREVPVSLTGWQLQDAAGNIAQLGSNPLLPAKQFAVVAQDLMTLNQLELPPGVLRCTPLVWTPLNNDGDRLILRDLAGTAIDSVNYSARDVRVRGRSLERVNPYLPGMEAANWGPCADPNRHTAGRPNSLQPPSGEQKARVNVSPNPFNPLSASETAVIRVMLPAAVARLNVDIYDLHRRLVRRLASNIPAGNGVPELFWDGRDDGGSPLPVGRYIISAEAVSPDGRDVFRALKTVVIADRLR